MRRLSTFEALFEELAVWSRGSERAPHKPLLALLALGLYSRGLRSLPFAKYEITLSHLLREFGPSRQSVHPEYPFWRLCNDGVWKVTSDRPMRSRASNTDIPRTELRSANAIGQFPAALQKLLDKHPAKIWQIAQQLLLGHFPESIHEEILTAIGLTRTMLNTSRPRRDSAFRAEVLAAYQHRCALCGFDLKIANASIGLEAAHIKWHQALGPDSIQNGLALCVLHHRLFDLGAFSIQPDLKIVVSEQIQGGVELDYLLLRYRGRMINLPSANHHRPHEDFVAWHRREVFKSLPGLSKPPL